MKQHLCFLRVIASLALVVTLPLSVQGNLQRERAVVTLRAASSDVTSMTALTTLSGAEILSVEPSAQTVHVSATAQEIARLRSMPQFEIVNIRHFSQTDFPTLHKYMRAKDVREKLHKIAATFPSLTRVREIGRTHQEQPIFAVEISTEVTATHKPVVMFTAMHHSNEVMTTEIAMHMIETLTEHFGSDPEITEWLSTYKIVVVPQLNPDGNDLVHNDKPLWRKNARTLQGKEVGVDLNRNYPTLWGHCNGSSPHESASTYRGPQPASEPEVQAMLKLVRELRPIANISYHSYGEYILYPFGCKDVPNSAVDLFRDVASSIRERLEGDDGRVGQYKIGSSHELLYTTDGVDTDTHWREFGVLSFILEVNNGPAIFTFIPDYDRWRDVTVRRQEEGWKGLLRRMSRGAVRGTVHTRGNLADVSYTISPASNNDDVTLLPTEEAPPFKIRNSSGLIYNLSLNGRFVLNFAIEGRVVKRMEFQVENGLTDLGEIEL